MELLCIQTHSQGAVIAGNTYTLISDKPPCGCKNVINVGVLSRFQKGQLMECSANHEIFIGDGFWWISKDLFAPIASEEELTSLEKEKEGVCQ